MGSRAARNVPCKTRLSIGLRSFLQNCAEQKRYLLAIRERKCKVPIEQLDKRWSHQFIQVSNTLAIRPSAKGRGGQVGSAQLLVVVNLSIHSHGNGFVGVVQRLRLTVGVNNGQALVAQDAGVTNINAVPIRP
jgi:hypothetical protein